MKTKEHTGIQQQPGLGLLPRMSLRLSLQGWKLVIESRLISTASASSILAWCISFNICSADWAINGAQIILEFLENPSPPIFVGTENPRFDNSEISNYVFLKWAIYMLRKWDDWEVFMSGYEESLLHNLKSHFDRNKYKMRKEHDARESPLLIE